VLLSLSEGLFEERIMKVTAVILAISCIAIPVTASADSITSEINRNSAELDAAIAQRQREMRLQDRRYSRWFASLSPSEQKIETALNQMYEQYKESKGEVLPFTERNVVLVARRIGVSDNDMEFLRTRMEDKTEYRLEMEERNQRLDDTLQRSDEMGDDICVSMRAINIYLPGCK
jgi:hypothetical protein